MDNIQIVNNIKTLCNNNNISVSQLEKTLNLSPGLISRWAKTTPTLERLMDIVHFFEVTIDELIDGEIKSKSPDISPFNSQKIASLINRLYQQTKCSNIKWSVLNLTEPPIRFNESTQERLTDDKYDYYYSLYNDGCFIIVSSYDTLNNLILYILPDSNSVPELICSKHEQLRPLFELVSNNLKRQLNQMKTNRFIDSFIDDTPLYDLNRSSLGKMNENIS